MEARRTQHHGCACHCVWPKTPRAHTPDTGGVSATGPRRVRDGSAACPRRVRGTAEGGGRKVGENKLLGKASRSTCVVVGAPTRPHAACVPCLGLTCRRPGRGLPVRSAGLSPTRSSARYASKRSTRRARTTAKVRIAWAVGTAGSGSPWHAVRLACARPRAPACAYKLGICAMCGRQVLDVTNYKQSAV